MASNLLSLLATILLIVAAIVAYVVGVGVNASMSPSLGQGSMAGVVVGIFVFAQLAFVAAVGFVLVSLNDKLDALVKASEADDERRALPKENHRYKVVGLGLGLEADPTGLLVYELEPGSQAEAAGLQVDDLITRVNGVTLAHLPTSEHRIRALRGSAPKRIEGYRLAEAFHATLA